MLSRTANSTLNDAESIAKKMNDESSIEHLVLAILTLKVKRAKY
jgi:ATP-dependent Clp protease ATP-binding subunit ClpB